MLRLRNLVRAYYKYDRGTPLTKPQLKTMKEAGVPKYALFDDSVAPKTP